MQNSMHAGIMAVGPGDDVQSTDSRRPLVRYYDTTMMNLEALSIELNRIHDVLSPVLQLNDELAVPEGKATPFFTDLEAKFERINEFLNDLNRRAQYLADNVVL